MKIILECPENRLEPEVIALGLKDLCYFYYYSYNVNRVLVTWLCMCVHLSRYQLGMHAVWDPENVQRPWSQNVDETSTEDTRSSAAKDA